MYLMDIIANAAGLIEHSRQHIDPVMGIYGALTERLEGVPHFLLDSKATRTAVEINLGRPKVILEAMQHLRVPYTAMWFEWDDADRQALRDRMKTELSYKEMRPQPGRVGCLVEAEPDGRRGTLTWAWTTPPATDFANIGAIETLFDLDQMSELPEDRAEGLAKGNLAPMWLGNAVQSEALYDIWRHARFMPSAWGERFLRMHPNPDLMRAMAYADVVGEWIMAVAVLLLLTASRPIVDLVPVSQAKLNKRRLQRHQTPLYDHTRVTLHLTERETRQQPRQPLGYLRKSPRVHLVSSYLARRGDKHWIVHPYWRGEGETVSRHVSVRG